jgi:hypothetical protein
MHAALQKVASALWSSAFKVASLYYCCCALGRDDQQCMLARHTLLDPVVCCLLAAVFVIHSCCWAGAPEATVLQGVDPPGLVHTNSNSFRCAACIHPAVQYPWNQLNHILLWWAQRVLWNVRESVGEHQIWYTVLHSDSSCT